MKPNCITRILCLVLAFLCFPLFAQAYESVPDDILYVVNNPNPANRLNLRTKPDESAPSLGRYYNGVRLGALSKPSNGWINVYVEGTHVAGYMQTKYLVYNPSKPVPSAIPLVTVSNKNGTGLNLRASQSSASQNYSFVPNGKTVSVLAWGEQWCHVQLENLTGYVLTSGLSFSGTGSSNNNHNAGNTSVIARAYVINPDPADRLNLRVSVDAKGLGGASLGKYYTGVEAEILEYLTRGNTKWARVRIGAAKRAGYMQADFLAIDKMPSGVKAAMPAVAVKNPKATDHLNLRKEPSDKASSLGRYLNGTKVTVLGVVNNTWSHVKVDGLEGFMMNRYLSPMPSFAK